MYPKISNAQKLNFLNGLFSASVPVGLAYAGDVNETKREKDSEIGMLVGISMLGMAGGGITAILMESQGLFVVSRLPHTLPCL